jgi:ABC-type nickel/cobalt efflux system permease component RcnA
MMTNRLLAPPAAVHFLLAAATCLVTSKLYLQTGEGFIYNLMSFGLVFLFTAWAVIYYLRKRNRE